MMQKEPGYDVLIVFHAIPAFAGLVTQENGRVCEYPTSEQIISIYWASIDTQTNFVLTEWEYFIKPPNFIALSPETTTMTKITTKDLQEKGVSLSEAIQHFNDIIYTDYINKNSSFCLVVESEYVLTHLLPNSARDCAVKLPTPFFTCFNIQEEFRKFYKLPNLPKSLTDSLAMIGITGAQIVNLCQAQGKNILALIHHLNMNRHVFRYPFNINSQQQAPIYENVQANYGMAPQSMYKEPVQQVQQIQRSESRRSENDQAFDRERERPRQDRDKQRFFVRLRGLPFSAREDKIVSFFKDIPLIMDDVVLLYNHEGRVSGEAIVRLASERDLTSAFARHKEMMDGRYIEIFEAEEYEFNKAKNFHNPQGSYSHNQQGTNSSWPENVGVLRLRGLPYSCTDKDIYTFFEGFRIVKDGVRRGSRNGRPSGECYVVFESKDQAHQAMGKNFEKIGNRFIELFESSTREVGNYHPSSNERDAGYSRENLPFVEPEKRRCCLVMVGLPFRVTKNEIVEFFGDFDLREKSVYLISNRNKKFSGNALITFVDEREAQRALKAKNLSYMGSRYVELFEYH